jgi:hypothetical protein
MECKDGFRGLSPHWDERVRNRIDAFQFRFMFNGGIKLQYEIEVHARLYALSHPAIAYADVTGALA